MKPASLPVYAALTLLLPVGCRPPPDPLQPIARQIVGMCETPATIALSSQLLAAQCAAVAADTDPITRSNAHALHAELVSLAAVDSVRLFYLSRGWEPYTSDPLPADVFLRLRLTPPNPGETWCIDRSWRWGCTWLTDHALSLAQKRPVGVFTNPPPTFSAAAGCAEASKRAREARRQRLLGP